MTTAVAKTVRFAARGQSNSLEAFQSIAFYTKGYQGEGNMKRLNGSIQATALSNQAQKEKKLSIVAYSFIFFVVSIQSKKMYCDFNIPCSAQADRSAIDKLKLILSRLTQRKLLVYLQTKKKTRANYQPC